MKNPGIILLIGLVAALAAFAGVYFVGTSESRELLHQPKPELAWLKHEFNLGDEEFKRVCDLHDAYLPKCAERCKSIAEETTRLEQLMAQGSSITPEMEEIIARRAKMRADCESEMLKHFIEVSRTMPAEQGKRYLAWVREQRSFKAEGMEELHMTQDHSQHHH